jgi:2-amino-4,5-dihydroxy-6-oxo-7-(phosphooxy)heptanoate synthase
MYDDSFGRTLRTHRLFHHSGRLLVVPMDHGVTDGPVVGDGDLDRLVGEVTAGGADAVVLHKGAVRRVHPRRFDRLSLVVHLSAGTAHGPDPDDRCLVGTVAEAVRLGADAVSVHVNVGSRQQLRQLADLGTVAGDCGRWSVPLLAMMYPRGPEVADSADPALVAHAATIAAELGADLVKVPYPGSPSGIRAVVRSCPIPVLVAGGPQRGPDDLHQNVRDALRAGATGVAAGRNIIRSAAPGEATRALAALVHAPAEQDLLAPAIGGIR